MNWETGIDMYTPPCIKQIASGKLLYSTKNSAQLYGDLDGEMGAWQESQVQEEGYG